jgi:phosphoglycerate dehydrogenase-like enzyme
MALTHQIHVLSVRALTAAQLDLLRAATPRAEIVHGPADLAAAMNSQVEVLFTGRGNISIAGATGLKWVQAENAGVDHFHGTEIWRSPITLTSANGAHTPHMPEFVLSVVLSHAYKLPLAREYQQRQVWGSNEHREQFTPRELRGQTVGIVGYGAIGREIARLCKALGLRVLVTKRTQASSVRYDGYAAPGTGDADGVLPDAFFALDTPGQLHQLLNQSDVVILLVPMTDATRQLIGANELAQMKRDALLINIGRGGLIDQQALIDAMTNNLIGGAVLDVTDPEPLPGDHALWRTPNVFITPHIAGLSTHYNDNVVRIFAENLRRYADGAGLMNVVRRELGY